MSTSNRNLQQTFADLYRDWTAAVQGHDLSWLELHIAEDFVATSRPIKNLSMGKKDSIAAYLKMESLKIQNSVFAEEVNGIVLTHLVTKVEEERLSSDVGGLSAAELTATVAGKTIYSSDAWRRNGDVWQCLSHHMVGAIK